MKRIKNLLIGLIPALLAITIVLITEQVFQPGYALKSAVKVLAFAGAIVLYCVLTRRRFSDVVGLHKIKNIKVILLCMLIFFVGMAAAFLLFRGWIDLPGIRQSLMTKENLTKENCLFVFLYIIFCNSFLEECFFRGFVFGLFSDKRVGGIVSAVLFSVYHIGIFITWFNPLIFLLCLVGLAAVGLFLQWLCEKFGSVLASFMTHAGANVAIDVIGLLLIFEWI